MTHEPAAAHPGATRFGYFVVHVHAGSTAGARSLRVVVEDLGTHEKRSFQSAMEVGEYLEAWVTRALPVRGEPRVTEGPP